LKSNNLKNNLLAVNMGNELSGGIDPSLIDPGTLAKMRGPVGGGGGGGEARRVAVTQLSSFLREQHPSDVLMPTRQVGEKAPRYTHRGGQWTWDSWDRVAGSTMPSRPHDPVTDLCIVLQNLVVVDVDTEEQAVALEARFPVLLEAPAEATKRGRHYFFVRTPRM
jgi:hypothetical protein